MYFLTKKITRGSGNFLDKAIQSFATLEKTLDLGSAVSPYQKWFPNRVSVDIDPKSGADIICDAHELPVESESFSMILCTEMLEHMYNPKKAVDEMYRVLKPGGTLLLTTRFVYGLHDIPHDYFRFTKYGLRELFKEFEIQAVYEETSNFETIAALLQRLVFQSRFKGGYILDKLLKVIVLILAKILATLNFLIKKQYGNIQKSISEVNILASGYIIICKKN